MKKIILNLLIPIISWSFLYYFATPAKASLGQLPGDQITESSGFIYKTGGQQYFMENFIKQNGDEAIWHFCPVSVTGGIEWTNCSCLTQPGNRWCQGNLTSELGISGKFLGTSAFIGKFTFNSQTQDYLLQSFLKQDGVNALWRFCPTDANGINWAGCTCPTQSQSAWCEGNLATELGTTGSLSGLNSFVAPLSFNNQTKEYLTQQIIKQDGLHADWRYCPIENGAINFNGCFSYLDLPFQKSNEDFLNPERGFQQCNISLYPTGYFTYTLTNNNMSLPITRTFYPTTGFNWIRQAGFSIAGTYIRLDDYRTSDIPQTFLDDLDRGFQELRNAKVKTNIIFTYNFGRDSDGSFGKDTTKEWIFRHLDQVKPVLEKNQDVIFAMPAGFIGAWGEWHSSTNNLTNTTDERDILNKILDTLPPSRMVNVRYPLAKRNIFGRILESSESFGGTKIARTGHLNLCFLNPPDDGGTYAGDLSYWKNYISQETQYTPNGGETCGTGVTPLMTCNNALADLSQMHWSSFCINESAPLDKFKTDGCYDEISKRLGYRFVLKNAVFPQKVKAGQTLSFQIQLTNEGFAAPFNERPVYLVLENINTGFRSKILLENIDPRRWLPNTTSIIDKDILLSNSLNLQPGLYRAFLWLPDKITDLQDIPEYAIRMANINIWQPLSGYNLLFDNLEVISLPGDLNHDDKVNIFDLRLFLTNFLKSLTIFDYNKVVENFGK